MNQTLYELNSPPDPLIPFRLYRNVRYVLGYPPNWHEELELLYFLTGTGSVRYGNLDIPVSAGDLIVANSNVIHHIDRFENLSYHCIILEQQFCSSNSIPIETLFFQEKIRDSAISSAFLQILEAYDLHLSASCPYGAVEVRAKVLELLYLLCRDHLAQHLTQTNSTRSDLVKKVMQYIRKNYARPITMDDISRHTCTSKAHLSREFKLMTRRTIIDTLIQIRCEEARQLITQGTPIYIAASACGFENRSYFSRTFRKFYQTTPSSFLPK